MTQDDCYRELSNAVIAQAAHDYLDLISGFTKLHGKAYKAREQSLLHFFYSPWFALMTDLQPGYLIERLQKQAESFKLRYTVARDEDSGYWYACKVGEEDVPLTKAWRSKDTALKYAADFQGVPRRTYAKIRSQAEAG